MKIIDFGKTLIILKNVKEKNRMKKFYTVTISMILLMVSSVSIFAQQKNYWAAHNGSLDFPKDKGVARLSFPKTFKVFDLNVASLRQELFTVVDNSQRHSTVISLPNADGQMEQFEVFEASNFEPALQARFPEIRAFSGKGITDKYATLKLSISPQGIQTMIFRTEKPNEFIEPYSQDHTSYAVFVSQRTKGLLSWTCSTEEQHFTNELNAQVMRANNTSRSTGDLKTMRLAQSCNAEYSNYFGATSAAQVGLVLAAFNATLTRCNGCYEKDLAVHLNLIANSTNVIYYVAGTDPYTNLNSWNGQLQSTLTSVIGEANYDIGHMFGASGGGGNAGCIGCVCVNNQKGSGITSPADGIPQGDNFDIDYVVHEVGHQMGGNHTFSMSLEGTGVNKEIGSGITIMGYAGITSQDVAPHSIDIYHEATIAQIQSNLTTKTCPITTSLAGNNATPVVAAVGNYIIPKSTPFALTGSATDADGDPITYCWEQNDNSTASGAASVASATKTNGPNWLSFSPTSSPTRICPKLDRILAGQLFTGPLTGGDAGINIEYLSSVARTLNFRLTVRDNCPYSSTAPIKVGQTAFTDMTVTVNGTAGPFAVSTPNAAGITWQAGTSQTVIWSVNGSDQAPVSCANVKISLSTDGGYTWPVVIVDNTPNDGTETITVPNNVTTTARIKVEAVGNIFFDINNANFAITPPAIGFTFSPSAGANIACGSTSSATASLATTSTGGFSTPIDLTASGNPAGTTVTFGTSPLTPGNTTTVVLDNTSLLTPGTYNVTVTGNAGTITQTSTIAFVVASSAPPTVTAQPSNVSSCVGTSATFTTASSTAGVSYQWQVSTNGGTTWTDIAGETSSTYTIAAVALTANNNQYRAVITTQCGLINTNAATLSVNVATAITTQPSNVTLCAGNDATFNSTATGNGVTYQWQVSTDAGTTWTDISGATNASYVINSVTTAINGNKYRVIATVTTGGCPGSLNSNDATLTVNATPTVNSTASTTSICSGTPVTLTATGADTYSWTPGNATGASITVTPTVSAANPGVSLVNTYTVTGTLTNGCASTSTVSVTANPLPVVTLAATPANVALLPGRTVTLQATVTPSTGFVFIWRKDGVIIPNTSNTLVVDVLHIGSYTVEAADATGYCNRTSNEIVVKDSVTSTIFIYPNPNNGNFIVSFYHIQLNNNSVLSNKNILTIFDSKGARVFEKSYNMIQGYNLLNVDLKSASSGVYFAVLRDDNGNQLGAGKVVVKP